MSEQINKVLANTAQQFTTGEQLQARTNIGAVWTGDMTGYVSYSVIGGDTATSAISSINGSSIGGGDTSNCFPKTASALLQPVGDYLSSTDSALFYPYSGNPSGFLTMAEQVVTAISDDGVYITSINGKGLSGAGGTGGGGDQVVTATGGVSSYVTSINGSALSGIAPLDEATVSSIASSYAESAASSKLDSTAQVVTATAWNGTYITSINGTPLSGAGGISSATCSAIASSYAESAASGKLDNSASSLWYSTSNPSGFIRSSEQVVTSTAGTNGKVTKINGSALSASQLVTSTGGADSKVTSINGSAISGVQVVTATAGADGSVTSINGSALSMTIANPLQVTYGSGLETSMSSDGLGNSSLNIAVSAHMGALCTHAKWAMATEWTATAVDQILPYANYIGSPYGYDPYYLNWHAVLEAPYAARFDLVESADLKDGSPLGEYILDSCYVQAGNSSFVRLAGISYGYGNNMYMRNAYIKVHWGENPLNATLHIHTQSGYHLALCMGYTLGPVLTFPVQ